MARDGSAGGRSEGFKRAGTAGRAAAARAVSLIAAVVVGVLVVGILLRVLEANADNAIVGAVLDAARWLAGPFQELFVLDDAKLQVAVNWGIAAVVYLIVARLVARLLAP